VTSAWMIPSEAINNDKVMMMVFMKMIIVDDRRQSILSSPTRNFN
jgi:hypothetical protein